MFNKIKKLKEEYKWISKNIRLAEFGGSDDSGVTYESGIGASKRISSLFTKICIYLGIEANFISGYVKSINITNVEELIENYDFTWNYVTINGSNYLIDTAKGNSKILGKDSLVLNNDLFFGTNPEILILYHFPEDSQWQLLPDPYTFEKFNSMAFLFYEFYLYGFKTISPDSSKINEKIKIILTYDEAIPDMEIVIIMVNYNIKEAGENECNYSDGKAEIELNLNNDNLFYAISGIKTKYLGDYL